MPDPAVARIHALNGGRPDAVAPAATPERFRIPSPWTMAGLREMPEPEERWLVESLVPEDANILWAGYPKTYKTMLLQELAIALATATPFLGRFRVPEPRRVGLILQEDAKHRARRRYDRIAAGRDLTLRDLDRILTWFRLPLRLSSEADIAELAWHIEDRGIEYLHIDSWAYVATGNSNDADDVTPQLQALSTLRAQFPGLSVGLTHHARKTTQDRGGERLTDLIRNSSAFGAWFDVGMVLARSDERSPVTVRAEMRDLPAPEPFAFTVEDQVPAGPDAVYPTGWLRVRASDGNPAILEREAAAERFVPAVREYLEKDPGCSKEKLKRGITGDNALILAAFDLLCGRGEATYLEPEKPGTAGRCELIHPSTPAEPRWNPAGSGAGDNPADPAAHPRRGCRERGGLFDEEPTPADSSGVEYEEEWEEIRGGTT